jgi:3-oxoacyl-[acyl-carrier protein] reductase
LGHVDVVVNNGLFPVPAHAFGTVPFEVWKRKIEVELTGSFFLFKAVLPRMMTQQWGRIINFTGLEALQGTDALAGSTELGMVGMTRGDSAGVWQVQHHGQLHWRRGHRD